MCLRTTSALARLETKAAGTERGLRGAGSPPSPSPGQRGWSRPRALTFGAGRVVGAGGAVSGCGAARAVRAARGLCPPPAAALLPPPSQAKPSPRPPQPGEGSAEPRPPAPALRPPPAKLPQPPRSPRAVPGRRPPQPHSPSPPATRTSAAEAEGEEGQEGQQSEGLHGASARGPGRVPPLLPEQLYRVLRRGGAPGAISSTSAGPGAARAGGNCGLGRTRSPRSTARARREEKAATGQRRWAGGPSPAGLAAPSAAAPAWDGRWGPGGDALLRSPGLTGLSQLPPLAARRAAAQSHGDFHAGEGQGDPLASSSLGEQRWEEGEQVPWASWHRTLALQQHPPATFQAVPRNTLRKSLKPPNWALEVPGGCCRWAQAPVKGKEHLVFTRPSPRRQGTHPPPASPPGGL